MNNNKKERLDKIRDILSSHQTESQEELLNILKTEGFNITQATLSRDMKILKIIKSPDANGNYIYTLPTANYFPGETNATVNPALASLGFISLEFSGNLAVIKTRPGYAMGIASEIDRHAGSTVLGTIAGDDTILLIPRDGTSRKEIAATLSSFIPNIQSL